MTKANASNLLVEIGAEELPLSALDLLYSDFKPALSKLLEQERVEFDSIELEATPRRIVFYVSGLSQKQKDLSLEISGPSLEKSYDAHKKPTPALLGFMKSKGITERDIEIRDMPKGKFIFGKKHIKGKAVSQVLPEVIQKVFQIIPFKRGLRWDETGYKFPRPIRWIVALLGDKVLKFRIANVSSGKSSFGHRFLSPKSFNVLKADWKGYHKLLETKQVILSIEKRESLIRSELNKKYGQSNLDEELIHECAQLVEKPFLLEGGFPKEYLELPSEVLATCMKKHQRIFAIYQKGKLQNKFIAVLNGKRDGLKGISSNFENVLDSRLKDARFFFKEDTEKPLEDYRQNLSQIAYLGKLGSMFDKSERLISISEKFKPAIEARVSEDLKRVSQLAKNDLLTHLVFEMPELQGIVGGQYAKHFGDSDEVSKAIASQYLPKNLGECDSVVKKEINLLGAMFGILDRMDLLIGAFCTGIEPTGSQDPFALRRAGGILVKLIRVFNVKFSLTELAAQNCVLYGDKLTKKEGLDRFHRFLQERVAFELGLRSGSHEHEVLKAVMQTDFDDIAGVFSRYEKMIQLGKKDKAAFTQSIKIVQRMANILKSSKEPLSEWSESKLTEDKEKALAAAFTQAKDSIEAKIAEMDFLGANQLYAKALEVPVAEFFDKVMVNAEDMEIRKNRLSLLAEIKGLYTLKMADLSLLSRVE